MAEQVPLPRLTEGYLGKQSKFDEYGLSNVSHPDPVVYMADDQTEVEIIIGTEESTRMTTKLLSYERKQECNDFCLVRCLGPNYCYLIRPPTAGFYKFQLYALPSGVAGPNFIGVYNYIIYCPKTHEGVLALPKQYPMWKEGCYLYEPLGIPKGYRGGPVHFKLSIPGAKNVQVKVGEDWNELTCIEPGLFEGDVDLTPPYPVGTKAKVNVKFMGAKFNTLIEYTI
ncbi:kyphoscoliosis peptidase-like [Littorina saxatilis]|uniref:KY-like immunoglobulin-like domain-containing protein n=1 Tax=Littorina saxatilis TaxID=31220 RepID=A0AAN9BNE0_9CAEN